MWVPILKYMGGYSERFPRKPNSYRSRLTGETIWPATFLSVPDIARISKHAPYQTRGYVLTEEEQKTLSVVKDGDANILRQASKLLEDFKLNYGSLMGNRVPNEEDLTRSGKDMVEPANYAVVETLAPLKRPKALEKEKKRKNKERMDGIRKEDYCLQTPCIIFYDIFLENWKKL
uniref:Uncharacterized protein n=1 Tax=Caenorhabditis japonica TaxID=281687 RepID=A0A8R1HTR0_CAEJA